MALQSRARCPAIRQLLHTASEGHSDAKWPGILQFRHTVATACIEMRRQEGERGRESFRAFRFDPPPVREEKAYPSLSQAADGGRGSAAHRQVPRKAALVAHVVGGTGSRHVATLLTAMTHHLRPAVRHLVPANGVRRDQFGAASKCPLAHHGLEERNKVMHATPSTEPWGFVEIGVEQYPGWPQLWQTPSLLHSRA